MGQITITGASDDVVIIDGDISDEFSFYPSANDDDKHILAFSDGTLLRVVYDDDGIWRFTPIFRGNAELTKVEGVVMEDTNDVVTLTGDIDWVVFGEYYAKR